jgi:4-hydroxy-3-methylbut-2-enyl diphosphate reductase
MDSICLNEPEKGRFYLRYRGPLHALGAAAVVGAAVLAFTASVWCGGVLLAGIAAGLCYRVSVPARLSRLVKYRRLELIPGSKEIFTALAWMTVSAVLPYMADGMPMAKLGLLVPASLITFFLVFIRTIVLDMRDIEGDQIVGQETVPVILGAVRARRLLSVLAVFAIAGASYVIVDRPGHPYGYAMSLTAIYCMVYILLYNTKRLPADEFAEAIVDASFFMPAVVVAATQPLF